MGNPGSSRLPVFTLIYCHDSCIYIQVANALRRSLQYFNALLCPPWKSCLRGFRHPLYKRRGSGLTGNRKEYQPTASTIRAHACCQRVRYSRKGRSTSTPLHENYAFGDPTLPGKMTFRVAISTERDPQGTGWADIHTHPYTTAASAAGVVTKNTDRDSLRYPYRGIRRVRQLALDCESN